MNFRYVVYSVLTLIQLAPIAAAAEKVKDRPVPKTNEVVMSPDMVITATTEVGTITITAGKGLKRSYTWEGDTRSVEMWPRDERWMGSLGLYYPGPGRHWSEHNGIARGTMEEGQMHFDTQAEAIEWIDSLIAITPHPYVWRKDGLMVGWGKVLPRKQLSVEVWQINIAGKKPTDLPGSHDDKILVGEVDYAPTSALEPVNLPTFKSAIR